MLTRTLYLSLDPYMRGLMSAEGPGYAPPTPLGAPMAGGTVSRVVVSRHPGFQPGDLVLGYAGWQDYGLSDGADTVPLGIWRSHPWRWADWACRRSPRITVCWTSASPPGETVVVGAATGAVGAVVGQIARLKGARVVGIAGGADKCRYAEQELGFDLCLDRHAPDTAARLALACRTASTSISKASAARCSMPCCRY